jgi:hypothetical protein
MKKNIKLSALLIFCIPPLISTAQTQTRVDAGLQGNAGAVSGFFETYQPVNYPAGASDWWHLLDVRHSNPNNNFAMQFAGSFFNQDLYFRKTGNNPSQPWSKIPMEINGAIGFGNGNPENHEGWDKVIGVKGNGHAKALIATDNVISGIWSHDIGYYGAPAGGITGTYTNHPFSIVTGQTTKMIVLANGNVGIGIISPGEKLAVNGIIRSKEIKVEASNWPDYVFDEGYKVGTLKALESYIKANKHLPDMPTAKDIESNGLELGEMVKVQQKKIEELTLYLISLDKKFSALELENRKLKMVHRKR